MQQLESSLKLGVTCPVYLFWGEETLLLEQAVERIGRLTLPEGEDWNRDVLSGDDTDPAAVAELANSATFFGSRRLVIVRGVGWFRPRKRKNAAEGAEEGAVDIEPLLAYVKDPNPNTVLILIAQGDVPRNSRIFKAAQAAGRAVEFTSPKGGAREQWLKNYLHAAGKIAEPAAVSYMCLMCAEGLANLKSEADKLILYCEGRSRVSQEDAEAIVSASAAAGVFQLTDQAVARDPAAAVSTLRRLLQQGEAPQMLLSMLAAQYRNILLVKDMTARGFSQPRIASHAGVNPFVVKKCLSAARGYDYRQLIRALDILLAVDIDTKSGKVEMTDGMELAILRICAL